MRRRWCEDASGVFPWRELFHGAGLDLGAGDDALPFPDCKPFDKADGDANRILEYFQPESFDYVHASNVFEHLVDPVQTIRDCIQILCPGGHLIITVPDLLYEGFRWPSRYNADHKSTWSMLYRGSLSPLHIHIPSMLATLEGVEVRSARFVDTNYNYKLGFDVDQTFDELKCVEVFNEIVVRKL